jgi:hypothetical protein
MLADRQPHVLRCPCDRRMRSGVSNMAHRHWRSVQQPAIPCRPRNCGLCLGDCQKVLLFFFLSEGEGWYGSCAAPLPRTLWASSFPPASVLRTAQLHIVLIRVRSCSWHVRLCPTLNSRHSGDRGPFKTFSGPFQRDGVPHSARGRPAWPLRCLSLLGRGQWWQWQCFNSAGAARLGEHGHLACKTSPCCHWCALAISAYLSHRKGDRGPLGCNFSDVRCIHSDPDRGHVQRMD